ncbi:hypothetical protein Trisim1_004335 [Trichoderma cf. simile WF8]
MGFEPSSSRDGERAVAYAIQIMTRLQGTMGPLKQVTARRTILLIHPSDLHLPPTAHRETGWQLRQTRSQLMTTCV